MQPMLATRAERIPSGAEWAHEVKWDGIRALVEVENGAVRVRSRNENDVSAAYPELSALAGIGHDVVLDAEIVAFQDGRVSFAALAERMQVRDPGKAQRIAAARPVTLIVFDLLRLDGEDLTGRPLRERRAALLGLDLAVEHVQVPPTYDDGRVLMDAVRAQGLEGVVSKRWSSAYRPGVRSPDWLKFPIRPSGSFLIGGYRHESGSGTRLGAILVGEPTAGGLVFRGRVGSGVAGRAASRLQELLRPLERATSPFSDPLPEADRSGTVWVQPQVVAEVEYLNLTPNGRLRQPAYRGVRTDLDPESLSAEAGAGDG